jgi:cobaltochelatase CobS
MEDKKMAGIIDKNGNERVRCEVCGAYKHQLSVHLKTHGMDVEEYKRQHPGAPTISEYASRRTSEAQKKAQRGTPAKTVQAAPIKPGSILSFGVANLAINNEADIGEGDRKHIPIHDPEFDLDPDMVEILALGIEQGDNVMIIGPTGCGKTAGTKELACLLSQPVRRVNLHGDVRASDFVGEKVVDVDPVTSQAVVVWKDGVLPEAMRKGYWMLLDEVDAGSPGILFVLQAVLDSGMLVLTGNGGEVIHPHPNFRIVTTANTNGQGDDTGMYTAGTQVLNEAFLDRFGTVISQGYLPEDKEAKVVARKAKITISLAKKMVECAKMVRAGLDNEECRCTLSTRRLIAWAQKADKLGTTKAAQVTIINKLNNEDADFVKGIIQRVIG